MMGPYMAPMALNVPVAMFMSMVVAFTITPWLSYHVLKPRTGGAAAASASAHHGEHDIEVLRHSTLWKLFYPLMAPLLRSRVAAWGFLLVIAVLTAAAMGLAAARWVPLKMLPFDNKNELLLVLDMDEGTTLERTDACVRDLERYLATQPEVANYASYVGLASPMDFNGMVRHYYLRRGEHVADVRINLVHKKSRRLQSHALGLRMRDELTAIAARHAANLKIVELPPGPPVIATLVAEVCGRPDQTYDDLAAAAKTVRARLEREPSVVDVDDTIEAPQSKLTFIVDKEKAALSGVSTEDVAQTLAIVLGGRSVESLRDPDERYPLRIELRLPRDERSSAHDLAQVHVKGRTGELVSLAEIGTWQTARVDQTIYHKNLERVVYVFAETAGRPPADAVVDLIADQAVSRDGRTNAWRYGDSKPAATTSAGSGWVETAEPRPVASRNFILNGGGVRWFIPEGIRVAFAGEGEWQITLDVFRDLGLAFGAAMIGIYILLVAQTRSFSVPVIVMLAIPLTVLGVMPGFWLLTRIAGQTVGGYADPVFFTATGMIGMIALAGIVTRDAIILVDFIHLSLKKGRSLFDAIMESRVVRLRPILLTAGAAMLGAAPITIDPIFSGLAWALIFGLFASTVFTLFVIPVAYWLLYAHKPGHGVAMENE
jgi:multidrug efflux pump subunit AcrB